MEKYKIADLIVKMNIYYDRLKNQSLQYLTDSESKEDITIDLPMSFYEDRLKENPHLTIADIEYIFAGSAFYNNILDFDGFLLHSSSICYNNEAYLFSAPSGTGKSTHTRNWFKYFGKENVYYINDDKPVIKKIDDKFYCCGSPFSGKEDLSRNVMIPIKAIVFVKRGLDNSMRRLENKEAIDKIMDQTVFSRRADRMMKLLELLDKLLQVVPVYELTCNMDVESAKVCYEFINK